MSLNAAPPDEAAEVPAESTGRTRGCRRCPATAIGAEGRASPATPAPLAVAVLRGVRRGELASRTPRHPVHAPPPRRTSRRRPDRQPIPRLMVAGRAPTVPGETDPRHLDNPRSNGRPIPHRVFCPRGPRHQVEPIARKRVAPTDTASGSNGVRHSRAAGRRQTVAGWGPSRAMCRALRPRANTQQRSVTDLNEQVHKRLPGQIPAPGHRKGARPRAPPSCPFPRATPPEPAPPPHPHQRTAATLSSPKPVPPSCGRWPHRPAHPRPPRRRRRERPDRSPDNTG